MQYDVTFNQVMALMDDDLQFVNFQSSVSQWVPTHTP